MLPVNIDIQDCPVNGQTRIIRRIEFVQRSLINDQTGIMRHIEFAQGSVCKV